MSESHAGSLPAYRSANELRFSHGMLQGGRLLSLGRVERPATVTAPATEPGT
jgi:hypothetical protein